MLKENFHKKLPFLILGVIVLPGLIYILSYGQWWWQGHSVNQFINLQKRKRRIDDDDDDNKKRKKKRRKLDIKYDIFKDKIEECDYNIEKTVNELILLGPIDEIDIDILNYNAIKLFTNQ